jgi:hypothetical protein
MGIGYNYSVPTDGLKMFVDEKLNQHTDNARHKGIRRGDNPYVGLPYGPSPTSIEWIRNVTEITISVVVYRNDIDHTSYAHHPIAMWGTGHSLLTAGFILYHFGNFNGNYAGSEGVLTWYWGDYDGTSGGWRGLNVATGDKRIQRGEYYHVAAQIGDGVFRGWRNGQQVSSTGVPRVIAPSNISGYGQNNLYVHGPSHNPSSFTMDVKTGMWYNRRCSDQEIQDHYKYFARRYPLETR